jgi:hypothetical protein
MMIIIVPTRRITRRPLAFNLFSDRLTWLFIMVSAYSRVCREEDQVLGWMRLAQPEQGAVALACLGYTTSEDQYL